MARMASSHATDCFIVGGSISTMRSRPRPATADCMMASASCSVHFIGFWSTALECCLGVLQGSCCLNHRSRRSTPIALTKILSLYLCIFDLYSSVLLAAGHEQILPWDVNAQQCRHRP